MASEDLCLRGSRGKLLSPDASTEVDNGSAEDQRAEEVDFARHAEHGGCQRHRHKSDGVDHDGACSGESVGLDDRKHADACAFVIFTIEKRDGMEVRELPEEEDGE